MGRLRSQRGTDLDPAHNELQVADVLEFHWNCCGELFNRADPPRRDYGTENISFQLAQFRGNGMDRYAELFALLVAAGVHLRWLQVASAPKPDRNLHVRATFVLSCGDTILEVEGTQIAPANGYGCVELHRSTASSFVAMSPC